MKKYHCSDYGHNIAELMRVLSGRTIYEKLANAFTEEQAVLYNQRVEEISPNIRYCAYNIGKGSGVHHLQTQTSLLMKKEY